MSTKQSGRHVVAAGIVVNLSTPGKDLKSSATAPQKVQETPTNFEPISKSDNISIMRAQQLNGTINPTCELGHSRWRRGSFAEPNDAD
jgi:hypothetical protein